MKAVIVFSESVTFYVKNIICSEETGRESEVFEGANLVTFNFDLSDPLSCRNLDPHFSSFHVTLRTSGGSRNRSRQMFLLKGVLRYKFLLN